ncbi:hypothetical protein F5Y04DRAFT_281292 [Hypomontagnella monticulosa]|nr:hypothetical protein F5Y04DRAFT_281292 [Hypomontagnella monticulosa]
MASNDPKTPKQDGNNTAKDVHSDDALGFEEISLNDNEDPSPGVSSEEARNERRCPFVFRKASDGFVDIALNLDSLEAHEEMWNDPELESWVIAGRYTEAFKQWIDSLSDLEANTFLDAWGYMLEKSPSVLLPEEELLVQGLRAIKAANDRAALAPGLTEAGAAPTSALLGVPQKTENKDKEGETAKSSENKAEDESADAPNISEPELALLQDAMNSEIGTVASEEDAKEDLH